MNTFFRVITICVFFVLVTGANAGEWSYGQGPTIAKACELADRNIAKASECSCYDSCKGKTDDRCEQTQDGGWECKTYVHHHSGSCESSENRHLPRC